MMKWRKPLDEDEDENEDEDKLSWNILDSDRQDSEKITNPLTTSTKCFWTLLLRNAMDFSTLS